MNRNVWLAILLIILWMSLASFWYLFRIKLVGESSIAISQNDTTSNTVEPLSVRWNSSDILFGANYDSAMYALTSTLNSNDTLLITGFYLEGEQGPELGYSRAEQLKKSLKLFIDSNLIQLESALKTDVAPNTKKPFSAFSFLIKPNTPKAIEPIAEPIVEVPKVEPPKEKPEVVKKVAQKVTNTGKIILFEGRTIDRKSEEASSKLLNELAETLKKNKGYRAKVTGFTNVSKDSKDDYQLGRKRAWVIKKSIMNLGIDPDRIKTDAKSGSGTPAEQQRVEIEIIKK